MIIDLFLDLSLIGLLNVGARSQDFQHDLLAALIPVLGQVDFGVGALIDLFLDLISLVNHDSFVSGRARLVRGLLLASHLSIYDLLGLKRAGLLNIVTI